MEIPVSRALGLGWQEDFPSMAQATKLFDLSPHAAAPAAKSLVSRTSPLGVAFAPVGSTALEPIEPPAAPRKLVRPRLPDSAAPGAIAPRRLRGSAPLARHQSAAPLLRSATAAASQAEAFYFQKQMQTQTPMVFVLEDGERIEGVVEWFDRDTIKVRNTTRTLIFKRSIKYLHKAGGDTQ